MLALIALMTLAALWIATERSDRERGREAVRVRVDERPARRRPGPRA